MTCRGARCCARRPPPLTKGCDIVAWQRDVAATAGEEATVSAATGSPVVALSAMSALTMILALGRFIRVASYGPGTLRYVLHTSRYAIHTVACYLPDVCAGRP